MVLSAYRVLDLTDHRGQLAAHILCSLGAEVLLLEPPGGSPARTIGPFAGDDPGPERSLPFWGHNRGKQSVVVDLDDARGRERFLDLVRSADVLIENEPVGAMAARGLGADALAEVNDALVHVSITPFGETGPKAHWAASDLTLLASSGALALTGDKDRPPLRFGPAPQAWHHGAAEAAQAALIALYERDNRSGLGQHADVSVQQAANQVAASQMLTSLLDASLTSRAAGGVVYGGIDIKLMWPCADGYVSVTFLFGAAIGPFTRRFTAASRSSALVLEAKKSTRTRSRTRSYSASGSRPSISMTAYSIQSLSRVASSQNPSSYTHSMSRRVKGPMAAPKRKVTDT